MSLQTKRVMSLDVAQLMAGAKERGELEERVTKLLKEIIKSGEYILTKKEKKLCEYMLGTLEEDCLISLIYLICR